MKTKYVHIIVLASLFCFSISVVSVAQIRKHILKALGSPADPKVDVRWDRYYDSEALGAICKRIVKSYPGLARLQSIGKSFQGRNLWCLEITNFQVSAAKQKPAIYIQANIHGNELQGAEFALYTAWYLTECFKDNPNIRQLLTDKVFYILPSLNPDGRDYFIHRPEIDPGSGSRFEMIPKDIDGDGKKGEDGFDDLDGDGDIVQMRKKDINGIMRVDPKDSRIMRQLPFDSTITINGEQKAQYPRLGNYDVMPEGGIDNDHDGKIDEDGVSSYAISMVNKDNPKYNPEDYDLNRNWGFTWNSADKNGKIGQPFSFPETQAVRDFFRQHPNIIAAQSLHDSGGELAPGATKKSDIFDTAEFQRDTTIYNKIGRKGESLLPGYKYLGLAKFKQGSRGSEEIDWMYGRMGAYSFLSELWTTYLYYQKKRNDADDIEVIRHQFDDDLLFGDGFVPWHKFNHPTLGAVEIGGFKKGMTRLEPGFMMEEEAHRNMAFTIYLAQQTPNLQIKAIRTTKLNDGEYELSATIANTGLMPTHTGPDLAHQVSRQDRIELRAPGKSQPILLQNSLTDTNAEIDNNKLSGVVSIKNIPGHSELNFKWLVRDKGTYKLSINSIKGGTAVSTIIIK